LSNILLLESLKHLDISVGSTIYRLNSIGVVILSVLVLQESIEWIKGTGIVLGVIAVFLLYEPSKFNIKNSINWGCPTKEAPMFARLKKSGKYQYLQIVENRIGN